MDGEEGGGRRWGMRGEGENIIKNVTSTLVSNTFSTLEKDIGKPMDNLIDDTRKKMETLPRKTSIWSGTKVDSPERNVVFSPETKLHYFDRDDIEFEDMEQAIEEVEYGNTSSENG
ncbi:hypothetical protein Tco_1106085 [Tanacetum coccineum]